MACHTPRVSTERRLLLDLLHPCGRGGPDQSVSARNPTNCVSAKESLPRHGELRCTGVVRGGSVDCLRFRGLPLSIARASIFHFRTAAQRCRSSILLALRRGV